MHQSIKTIVLLLFIMFATNICLQAQAEKDNKEEEEIDDFQRELLRSDQCNDQGDVWTKSWVSCEKSENPNPDRKASHWIMYEFDQAESITTSFIWNANRIGESTMGVRNMYVDFSVDGTTWQTLGTFTVQRAAESSFYQGSPGPDFGGVFMKKILFTVQTTYGNPNCASLAEVQFDIDQTACYGTLDECGVCDGTGVITWYEDADNDGLGNPDISIIACNKPNGFVSNSDDNCDTGILGWAEIGPLFEENGCTGCHGNVNPESGLDLRTFESFSQGGNKCGSNLLTGTTLTSIITIDGYNGCSSPIGAPAMNARVSGQMDNQEIFLIQVWIDSGAPEFCQCPPGASDLDNDGVCDEMDFCPEFDNRLIGTSCNDGLPCTMNDMIDQFCNCVGSPSVDSDHDGVCDALDAAPNEPCTADGVIDGTEPNMWTGSANNDCDSDGVPLGQGDLDDFSTCINQFGASQNASCNCGNSREFAGGKFVSGVGLGFFPSLGSGLPDGAHSGLLGADDRLVLSYPPLPKGTEICFVLGFDDVNGIAGIELNDIGTYFFENTHNLVDYTLQQYCVTTIENGPQKIAIRDIGEGGIRVDGSTYEYCPCTSTDLEEFSPDCQCPANQFSSTGDFVSEAGFTGGINAAGLPDGIFTETIGFLDTLILSYNDLLPNTKICLTAGFYDTLSVLQIDQSGEVFTFQNLTDEVNYAPQEFCFVTPAVLTDKLLYLTDVGLGATRVDGSRTFACIPCSPIDPDSDGDGVCDSNDPCPNSPTNDSDYDGVCDDIDICVGFDDNLDTDGDGIPNGCDVCPGRNDNIDDDNDGVPNGCDSCLNGNDFLDSDNDGIPNVCDSHPCLNFIVELTKPDIKTSKKVIHSAKTNGIVPSNNNVSYKAGQKVVLLTDFEVKDGAIFLADIEPCP